ncbi:hypothetical protein BH11PSE4_BH11PSE4_27380 [soil metagenome]
MLSRALSLATVMLLSFAAVPVQAQNLEAGKSPSQIFSGTCTACHKSPRGLLKTVTPGSLPGFLRQHYTTSSDMASALSAYVISNGAADTRSGGGLTRQGRESTSEPRPAAAPAVAAPAAAAPADDGFSFFGFGRKRPAAQEAAKPDADGPPMTRRQKRAADRAAKRLARPAPEVRDAARPASEPPAAEAPRAQKQKHGKKGRRVRDEATKPDAAETSKPDEIKPDVAKPEPAREAVKPEAPLRADPVPAVTPAPKAPEPEPKAESKPEAEPKSE